MQAIRIPTHNVHESLLKLMPGIMNAARPGHKPPFRRIAGLCPRGTAVLSA